MTPRTIPALLLAALAVVPSQATQLVPTRLILVKNPVAGPAARLVVWKARERPSGNTIIGDPTVGGAKLRIRLRPGGDECVTLPRTGWTRIGTGYRYKDAALANGPVRTASIKKKLSGTFQIQAILVGSGVTVVPGAPTVDYATNLSLVGGDDYRSGWGGAFPHPNDAFTFKVKNDGAAGVQVDPCSPGGAFLDPSLP